MATNRKPVSIPVVGTDIDVGHVALIMNAISAMAALPTTGNGLTLWWKEYGASGELAFRSWAAANARAYELDEYGCSLRVVRRGDRETVATYRIDLASYDAHPISPDHTPEAILDRARRRSAP